MLQIFQPEFFLRNGEKCFLKARITIALPCIFQPATVVKKTTPKLMATKHWEIIQNYSNHTILPHQGKITMTHLQEHHATQAGLCGQLQHVKLSHRTPLITEMLFRLLMTYKVPTLPNCQGGPFPSICLQHHTQHAEPTPEPSGPVSSVHRRLKEPGCFVAAAHPSSASLSWGGEQALAACQGVTASR